MGKVDELRELPTEEVRARLEETREELFNLRFQHATGQLENYRRLGLLRRDVARILTVIRERELGIETPEATASQAEA
jgi:large subunit ribosomal protein L29